MAAERRGNYVAVGLQAKGSIGDLTAGYVSRLFRLAPANNAVSSGWPTWRPAGWPRRPPDSAVAFLALRRGPLAPQLLARGAVIDSAGYFSRLFCSAGWPAPGGVLLGAPA